MTTLTVLISLVLVGIIYLASYITGIEFNEFMLAVIIYFLVFDSFERVENNDHVTKED